MISVGLEGRMGAVTGDERVGADPRHDADARPFLFRQGGPATCRKKPGVWRGPFALTGVNSATRPHVSRRRSAQPGDRVSRSNYSLPLSGRPRPRTSALPSFRQRDDRRWWRLQFGDAARQSPRLDRPRFSPRLDLVGPAYPSSARRAMVSDQRGQRPCDRRDLPGATGFIDEHVSRHSFGQARSGESDCARIMLIVARVRRRPTGRLGRTPFSRPTPIRE